MQPVRRGRIVELFEDRGIFELFKREKWPYGETKGGKAECERCRKIKDKYVKFLRGGTEERQGA
jgi:hypothetical protein